MIDIILGLVIVAQCGLIAWLDLNDRKERSKLVNALIAKTPEQLRDLEFTDKIQPPKMESIKQDIFPTETLSDEEFSEMIKEENNG